MNKFLFCFYGVLVVYMLSVVLMMYPFSSVRMVAYAWIETRNCGITRT